MMAAGELKDCQHIKLNSQRQKAMYLKHNNTIRKFVLAVMIFSLCFGVSSPAFAYAHAATGSSSTSLASLTGWFSIIWGDSQDGLAWQQLYYLKSDDGTSSIQLRLDEGIAESLGGVLAVNGKRVSVDGDWSVSAADSSETATFQVLSLTLADETDIHAAGSPQALTGSRPWVSILCKFNDVTDEPRNLAYFLGMYSSSKPGLDHYWREVSYNNINILGSNAVGWYTLPHPRSYYVYNNGFDHNRAATDCTGVADPQVNFTQYVGISLMFNDDLDGYAWGGGWYGTLDGVSKVWSMTWEPPWGYTDIMVISHEMGHGVGLPHSSGTYGQTYDNQWDVMSDGWSNCSNSSDATYGCLGQHTIAYHKDILGWIPANQKSTPTGAGTTTITLEQLALPQTGNYLMAQIPIGGSTTRFYTVEVRRKTGYDVKLPGQAVIIHEVDTTRDIPAHVIDADNNGNTGDAGAMWIPGETFTDTPNGISVSVLSTTSTGFRVSITYNPSGGQTLTVSKSGTGSGTVTSSPSGINCGSACSYAFPYNTVVTLTATPVTGSAFTGWSGAGCSGTGTCTVTMTAATSVTAGFDIVSLPNIPVLVAPGVNALVSGYTPIFDWTDVTPNLDHYEIEIAAEAGFTSMIDDDPALLASTYTPATDLPSNSTFYWRVRSVDPHGVSRGWTAARIFRTALLTPLPSAPGDATHALSTKPTFDWSDVTGATNYTIQVSKNNTFTLLIVNINPSASTYTPATSLPVDLTLYWRVCSNGSRGPSAWSSVYSFHSANPPSVPVLLLPGLNALTTDYTPRLDWSISTLPAGTLFDHYQVQMDDNADFSSPVLDQVVHDAANHEYTPASDLAPNTKYNWRVRAYNADGEYSAWSVVRYFRTAMLPPILQVPGDATSVPVIRPTFDWSDTSGASSYSLQVSKNNNFTLLVINATISGGSKSQYTPQANLPTNTILYWRVKANGPNGPSLWSTPAWSFTTPKPPSVPLPVSPLSNALVTDTSPTLRWSRSAIPSGTTFDHYQVQIATDAAFTTLIRDADVSTYNTPVYTTSPDLNPNMKYYWHARAWNTLGQYSMWSSVSSFRTALSAPALVLPTFGGSTTLLRPAFDWNDVPGAASYSLQVSRNNSFTLLVVNTKTNGATSTYTPLANLPAGVMLYWRARANGANGPSLWSPTWSFTVTP
jgi:M6 family metalloprotease-like protein